MEVAIRLAVIHGIDCTEVDIYALREPKRRRGMVLQRPTPPMEGTAYKFDRHALKVAGLAASLAST